MEEFFLTYVENLMCCILFFANFPRRKHFPAYFLSLAVLAGGVLSVVGHVLSIQIFWCSFTISSSSVCSW